MRRGDDNLLNACVNEGLYVLLREKCKQVGEAGFSDRLATTVLTLAKDAEVNPCFVEQ